MARANGLRGVERFSFRRFNNINNNSSSKKMRSGQILPSDLGTILRPRLNTHTRARIGLNASVPILKLHSTLSPTPSHTRTWPVSPVWLGRLIEFDVFPLHWSARHFRTLRISAFCSRRAGTQVCIIPSQGFEVGLASFAMHNMPAQLCVDKSLPGLGRYAPLLDN